MSEKYKFVDGEGIYHVTLTIVHWIDLFTRKEYVFDVLESLRFCQANKGLKIHAWVIMPSHLHMIVSSRDVPLSDIMRDFKKYTNKKIIESIQSTNESRKKWLLNAFSKAALPLKRINGFKVWMDGNHPILLDNNFMMEQRVNYIHNNPVEAGMVMESYHYTFSSAVDYAGQKGLLGIDFIE
ncbi:transposase [Cytophagales bacterium LB-30]|uniref:Transposase n=1 Tax=Shiella aurantiaca TaxID=3058365 RepID=A0ABT8F4H0_9BACT|nr:transposase [Shiella aurantiaca]MDN4165352.1 transposase [Shiella aurantiaca]